jgi:hypothetical protein
MKTEYGWDTAGERKGMKKGLLTKEPCGIVGRREKGHLLWKKRRQEAASNLNGCPDKKTGKWGGGGGTRLLTSTVSIPVPVKAKK